MSADQPPGRRPKGLLVLRTQAMPQDANANGDIFGGWIFAQMDKASGLFAAVVSAGRAVTVTVDKLVFEHPVHIGDAVTVYAQLQRVGNSSMDIELEAWTRDLFGTAVAEPKLVTEGVVRYVAIDDHGRPRRVPDNPKFFSRQ